MVVAVGLPLCVLNAAVACERALKVPLMLVVSSQNMTEVLPWGVSMVMLRRPSSILTIVPVVTSSLSGAVDLVDGSSAGD